MVCLQMPKTFASFVLVAPSSTASVISIFLSTLSVLLIVFTYSSFLYKAALKEALPIKATAKKLPTSNFWAVCIVSSAINICLQSTIRRNSGQE